ncbi:M28 family peptidase [Longimicrobium sp.]|uniref:M28 family peptidase n=1 Tax=Longimicrobium sp. TaxID=2029185 RepID=UPI002E36C548|nr:M28 family peptidase [Longimicrobium sp.]HEX6038431.1 M28 family peptidase [Longimicrobium sp.]
MIDLRRYARPLVRAARMARRRWERGPIRHETIDVGAGAPAGDGAFDGARAFELLRAQCDMGPRAPGTDGHRRTLEWIVDQLRPHVDALVLQRWEQKVRHGPGAGRRFAMTNVLALVHGRDGADGAPDLMLSAHWDTRPVADSDPDPARRALPVPGANDGASGTAVVLEAARALRAHRPSRSVALALWDGEDLGEYYYGSHAYEAAFRRGTVPWRPRRGILMDMVGKRGLRCSTEGNSMRLAPELWRDLHACAEDMDLGAHFGGRAYTVNDDHVFLSRAGIPTVLLIDYDYPQWHTTADTVDQCDAASLRIVGDVVLRYVRAGAA